jgi:hypothetical protein
MKTSHLIQAKVPQKDSRVLQFLQLTFKRRVIVFSLHLWTKLLRNHFTFHKMLFIICRNVFLTQRVIKLQKNFHKLN